MGFSGEVNGSDRVLAQCSTDSVAFFRDGGSEVESNEDGEEFHFDWRVGKVECIMMDRGRSGWEVIFAARVGYTFVG